MSLNGSGVYQVNSTGQPVVAGTLISAATFNAFTADIAAALSTAVFKDGQQTITANLPMGGYKLTGLAAGSTAGDSVRYEQLAGSITQAFAALSIDLGHASDTTLTRVSAGVVAIEGVNIATVGAANTWTAQQKFTKAVETAKGANVASAATCDIWTPADGNLIHITGTTGISSFGTAPQAGTSRRCIADSGFTITYNATTLKTPGAADLVIPAGGEFTVYADTTANMIVTDVDDRSLLAVGKMNTGKLLGRVSAGVGAVEEISLTGKIIQIVEGTPYTGAANTTTVIPLDTSKPQNTEGTEYATVTITPTNASNRLVITADASHIAGSGAIQIIGAMFQDAGANSIAVSLYTPAGAGYPGALGVRHEMAAGTTSATTFKFRIGPTVGTAYINTDAAGNTLGGLGAVRMRVEEIAV